MVLRAVSLDVDLDPQQNDEPVKGSRRLAPLVRRSRNRDQEYPAVNRVDELFGLCVELRMEERSEGFVVTLSSRWKYSS